MPKTIVDLDMLQGEDWTLSLELSDGGLAFNFTDYKFYFTMVEDFGLTPIIDISTLDVGQTAITVGALLGTVEVHLGYLLTYLKVPRVEYSLLALSPSNTATFLILGTITVFPTPKQLPIV